MIKREEINIEINNKTSNHILYSNDNATSLVVVFPGGNNNATRPFLYYLRDYFLRANYDVINISYTNLFERSESFEEQLIKMTYAIHQAITQHKETKKYQKYLFVSRSIGNVIANKTKIKYPLNVIKSIYVCPTSEALVDIKKYPGLIISATNDEYLNNHELEEVLLYPNHEVLIFKGGDHNLECDDTLETIKFLGSAVSKVIEFVNKK